MIAITGMEAVDVYSPNTDGERDCEIWIERPIDGEVHCEEIDVAKLFAPGGETFDPTTAVEFTRPATPDTVERVEVGDVVMMRVSVER